MNNTRQENKSRRPNNAVVGALLKSAHALLGKCLIELYKQAKDPDFRRDPNAKDLYTRYDALDSFVGFHESIISKCLSEAKQNLLRFSQSGTHDLEADQSLWDIQVIETSEIELAEAVAPLAESLETQHSDVLLHLQVRIDCLNKGLPEGANPQGLHPKALFQAFQKAINSLGIKVAAKLILCQCFHDLLRARVGDFYQKINQALSDSGILNEEKSLKNALYVERLKARGGSALKNKGDTPAGSGDAKPAGYEKNSFLGDSSDLSLAQSSEPSLSVDVHYSDDDRFIYLLLATESPGTGSMLSPYQRAQIVGALSLLQRSHVRIAQPPGEDEIKSSLSRILYDSGIFNASDLVQKESPAMDFVSKIFKEISEDATFSEVGKNLIAKLQIPTIKLALLDFGFFQNPLHPARRVLSLLGSLSVDIINDEDPLFLKLQAIVHKLLDKFDTDISIFDRALAEIKKLALKEKDSALKESLMHAQQQPNGGVVREAVGKAIANNLNVADLSGSFRKFLTEQFEPYLRVIYADQGPRSRSWSKAFELLVKIGTMTKNVPDQSEAGKAARLFTDVEKSLMEIFPSHNEISGMLSELRKLSSRKRIEKKKTLGHGSSKNSPVPSVEDSSGESPKGKVPSAQSSGSDDAACSLPDCLKTGTWFEIRQSEGKAKRLLKLSAILEDQDQINFANRSGKVELSLGLKGFLKDLQQGKSRPINDSNVFDRALNSVINNIRETQNRRRF